MTLARRSFITGLVSLVAAPAIIRAGSLMPVKVMLAEPHLSGRAIMLMMQDDPVAFQREINLRNRQLLAHRRWITLEEAMALYPTPQSA